MSPLGVLFGDAGEWVEASEGHSQSSFSARKMDRPWDIVLLVSWPAHQDLIDLAADEEYETIAHHRTNGLDRTMLIAMKRDLIEAD